MHASLRAACCVQVGFWTRHWSFPATSLDVGGREMINVTMRPSVDMEEWTRCVGGWGKGAKPRHVWCRAAVPTPQVDFSGW
jgi:hypothetical protein